MLFDLKVSVDNIKLKLITDLDFFTQALFYGSLS